MSSISNRPRAGMPQHSRYHTRTAYLHAMREFMAHEQHNTRRDAIDEYLQYEKRLSCYLQTLSQHPANSAAK